MYFKNYLISLALIATKSTLTEGEDPSRHCINFLPVHGGFDASSQSDKSLYYTLTANPWGNGTVEVVLTSLMPDTRPFTGFIIHATKDSKTSSDEARPIGTWGETKGTKRISCFRRKNTVLLNANHKPKVVAKFIWSAPKIRNRKQGGGKVVFRATVIETPERYWSAVNSEVTEVGVPPVPAVPKPGSVVAAESPSATG